MTEAVKPIIVYPRAGVKIYLPGGVHGFASGPVPMHPDHAAALAKHVMTEAEKGAADKAAVEKAAAEKASAEKAAAEKAKAEKTASPPVTKQEGGAPAPVAA